MNADLYFHPYFPKSWPAICSLDKRRRENKDLGYVYIMRNKLYKERIYKIGKTSRLPYVRRNELSSSTGVPGDFELIYYVVVSQTSLAERWVHQQLQQFRFQQNKEFFKVPLKHAFEVLDTAANSLRIKIGGSNSKPVFLDQDLTQITINCPSCGKGNRVKQILIPVRVTCPTCHFKYELRPDVRQSWDL